jgi:hypothetical protein
VLLCLKKAWIQSMGKQRFSLTANNVFDQIIILLIKSGQNKGVKLVGTQGLTDQSQSIRNSFHLVEVYHNGGVKLLGVTELISKLHRTSNRLREKTVLENLPGFMGGHGEHDHPHNINRSRVEDSGKDRLILLHPGRIVRIDLLNRITSVLGDRDIGLWAWEGAVNKV